VQVHVSICGNRESVVLCIWRCRAMRLGGMLEKRLLACLEWMFCGIFHEPVLFR